MEYGIDIQAIYNEGRAAFASGSVFANPYTDNFRADFWAQGFHNAARKAKLA